MDYDSMQIIINQTKQPAFTEQLHQEIRNYNNQHSPYHQLIRDPQQIQYLNGQVVIDDEIMGGISCEVYWGWMEINYLWLPAELRHQGIGSQLLKRCEQAAVELGCSRAMVTTFDFQGLSFYQQQGFQVVGMLENYPPGNNYYWLTKSLVE